MDARDSDSDGKLSFSATGNSPRDYLRRLAPESYRGQAFVHWTMAIENRRTGWLTEPFHLRWREALLHTIARYHLTCPAYVLMPDHWHILWIGLHDDSDQRKAAKFFREHSGKILQSAECELQKQAHDHVLREKDRARDAFAHVAHYILANPERAGLVADWADYPYLGVLTTGYPSLNPRANDYWDCFWKIHETLTS